MNREPKIFVRTTAPVQSRRLLGSRRWVWLAVVVLTVATVGGIFYALQAVPEPVAIEPADGPMSDTALDTAINNLYKKQDYGAAVKLAQAQVAKQDTPHRQMVLATAYSYHLDYDQAFAIYDSLDAAGQLSGVETMNAAQIAQLSGDRAKAISFFQKARAKIQAQPQDFATKRELLFIDQQITSLQR